MSDFKVKMHLIVCRLTALPRPPSWIIGGLLLRGRGTDEGMGGERREKGRGGTGQGRPPKLKLALLPPPKKNYFPGASAVPLSKLSSGLARMFTKTALNVICAGYILHFVLFFLWGK